MGWIVAGNVTPSFIEGNAVTGEVCKFFCKVYRVHKKHLVIYLSHCAPAHHLVCFKVWFAWLVLNMESMFEEDSQLRRCVEHELLSNSACTPDQALKVHIHSALILSQVQLSRREQEKFLLSNVFTCIIRSSESPGTSQASGDPLPAEADDLPLGSTSSRYTCRSPTHTFGVAEIPPTLPPSTWTRVWVRGVIFSFVWTEHNCPSLHACYTQWYMWFGTKSHITPRSLPTPEREDLQTSFFIVIHDSAKWGCYTICDACKVILVLPVTYSVFLSLLLTSFFFTCCNAVLLILPQFSCFARLYFRLLLS